MTGTLVPMELRALMKLSLQRSDTIAPALSEPFADPNDPHIRELIAHLYFTRSFIPTYYGVLATAIILFAIFRRYKNSRTRSGKNIDKRSSVPSSVASSSSSTIQGSYNCIAKDVDSTETTPLISDDVLNKFQKQSTLTRLRCTIQAFLMYQPAPIPAVTSSKNTLPPNETTIVVLSLLAVNVFYFFFRLPLTKDMLFIVADRAGLVFVVNLPVLYVLAAKNNQPLLWLTGWSYEGLNLFHRRLGEWMTVAALVHAVSMFAIYWLIIEPLGLSLTWYVTRPIVLLGISGFSLYLAIYLTSIGYVRLKLYESFLLIHVICQVGALVIVFFHHHGARPYVGAAFGIWVLDRFVWRFWIKRRSLVATLQIAADLETVLLSVQTPLGEKTFARQDISAGWYAGQHGFVTVPGMGWKHLLQTHPFTIASPAPPAEGKSESWPLHLAIRAQAGFSRELLEFAKHHQHVQVYIDGPYSSRDVLDSLKRSDRVCLIAGGSGIAVTFPYAAALHDIISQSTLVSSRTEYVAGRRRNPAFALSKSPFEESKFYHMWVRQNSKHESWIVSWPGLPTTSNVTEPSQGQEQGLDIITARCDTRSATGNGRPDIVAALEDWTKGDLKTRHNSNESICFVVSGPDTLVRDIRNAASGLVREGWRVKVHVEKFGW